DGDALQKVRAFVTLHLRFNVENLTKMGVFFHDFRSLNGERRQVIIEARDGYEELLRDLIRQGQHEAIICPDIDPKIAPIGVMGMLNSIYTWYVPGGVHSASEIAEEMSDLVVAGLACTPETHAPGHRSRLAPLPASLG